MHIEQNTVISILKDVVSWEKCDELQYQFSDADGYEREKVIQTKNTIDICAAVFVFHAYDNLYPNGRGGCDDYPLIWKRLEEIWPIDEQGNMLSIDEIDLFYYEHGVKLPFNIEYSKNDMEFIKSFKSLSDIAGKGTIRSARNDFDWSVYADLITEYVSKQFNSPKEMVTIFNQ